MAVTVKLKYLRIAPRKVRLVADMIRKKKIEEAQNILNFATKKAAKPLLKLLKTAIADARNNFQLDPNNLYISKITVDEGPKYKRWRPRSRGMVNEVQKKTSHLTLVLSEIAPGPPKFSKGKIRPAGKEVKKAKKEKPKTKKSAPAKPARTADKTVIEKEKKEEVKGIPEIEKPRLRPQTEAPKPNTTKGIRRIFRRKAF
jgi:large subunit ribosomal protein L22